MPRNKDKRLLQNTQDEQFSTSFVTLTVESSIRTFLPTHTATRRSSVLKEQCCARPSEVPITKPFAVSPEMLNSQKIETTITCTFRVQHTKQVSFQPLCRKQNKKEEKKETDFPTIFNSSSRSDNVPHNDTVVGAAA